LEKKKSNLAEITKGGNFEEFKSVQQHENLSNLELENHRDICLKTVQNQVNLRV
jgi:hypothetical protein